METHSLLIEVAIVLLSARLFGELALHLRAPPIIGELCAGIVIGPSLLGWVTPSEPFRLLAEIGIILLLFEVGLETDLQRLAKAGPKSVVVALAIFALVIIVLCSYLARTNGQVAKRNRSAQPGMEQQAKHEDQKVNQ